MFFFFTKFCNIDFQQPGSFRATKGGLGAFASDAIEKSGDLVSPLSKIASAWFDVGTAELEQPG